MKVFLLVLVVLLGAAAGEQSWAGQASLVSEAEKAWLVAVWDKISPQYRRFSRKAVPAFVVRAERDLNFFYDSRSHWVVVTTPAVRVFDGKDGEVAFFLSHELGHALVLHEPKASGQLLAFLRSLYYWPKGKQAPLSPKERESLPDMWGLCLMSAAGYNPTDAGAAFGRIMSVRGTGYEGQITWLDVHPSDQRRISLLHRATQKGLVQQCQLLGQG